MAYADLVAPLLHIAPSQRVDEDRLLQPKLGAVLSAAFLGMNVDSSDEQINAIASATIGSTPRSSTCPTHRQTVA